MLNVLLKTAVEWQVLDRMPCTIRLLPVPVKEADFFDFEEYYRLRQAAQSLDLMTYLIILLGGDAGLRCGEIMGARRCPQSCPRVAERRLGHLSSGTAESRTRLTP